MTVYLYWDRDKDHKKVQSEEVVCSNDAGL